MEDSSEIQTFDARSQFSRADRVCGAAWIPLIPPAPYTPGPRLMGTAAKLAADGEAVLPRYYAVDERANGGLLCVPSQFTGTAVVALYASPVDASMARRDWFRGAFSEVLCVPELVSDVVRVRELSLATALDIRRHEAEARGEEWTVRRNGLATTAVLKAPVSAPAPGFITRHGAALVLAAFAVALLCVLGICSQH